MDSLSNFQGLASTRYRFWTETQIALSGVLKRNSARAATLLQGSTMFPQSIALLESRLKHHSRTGSPHSSPKTKCPHQMRTILCWRVEFPTELWKFQSALPSSTPQQSSTRVPISTPNTRNCKQTRCRPLQNSPDK